MASGGNRYASRSKAKPAQGLKSSKCRARARHNALKLGLYAKTALLPSEDAKAYAKLRVAIFAEFDPRGALEEAITEHIIADLWRLNRFAWIENAFLEQTKLAVALRSAGSLPAGMLDAVQGRSGKNIVPDNKECPAHNSLAQAGHGSYVEIPQDGVAALLDAFVCRISQTPMEDLARQRRCASRELLRNIAALETLQARRLAVDTIFSARPANR
jgi:hypothetical protein